MNTMKPEPQRLYTSHQEKVCQIRTLDFHPLQHQVSLSVSVLSFTSTAASHSAVFLSYLLSPVFSL